MKTYYFYTLNGVQYPEKIIKYDEYLKENLEKYIKEKDALGLTIVSNAIESQEQYDKRDSLQNGQNARYLSRYGVTEITEETYNIIVNDEQRIVKNLNEKSLKLLNKFGHRTDGWHFPFTVEAQNKSHLKWLLKKMFPDYTEFILIK